MLLEDTNLDESKRPTPQTVELAEELHEYLGEEKEAAHCSTASPLPIIDPMEKTNISNEVIDYLKPVATQTIAMDRGATNAINTCLCVTIPTQSTAPDTPLPPEPTVSYQTNHITAQASVYSINSATGCVSSGESETGEERRFSGISTHVRLPNTPKLSMESSTLRHGFSFLCQEETVPDYSSTVGNGHSAQASVYGNAEENSEAAEFYGDNLSNFSRRTSGESALPMSLRATPSLDRMTAGDEAVNFPCIAEEVTRNIVTPGLVPNDVRLPNDYVTRAELQRLMLVPEIRVTPVVWDTRPSPILDKSGDNPSRRASQDLELISYYGEAEDNKPCRFPDSPGESDSLSQTFTLDSTKTVTVTTDVASDGAQAPNTKVGEPNHLPNSGDADNSQDPVNQNFSQAALGNSWNMVVNMGKGNSRPSLNPSGSDRVHTVGMMEATAAEAFTLNADKDGKGEPNALSAEQGAMFAEANMLPIFSKSECKTEEDHIAKTHMTGSSRIAIIRDESSSEMEA